MSPLYSVLPPQQPRRADYTQNHCFSDEKLAETWLRILKKSRVLPHYRVEMFREGEGKTRDVRETNRHSYKQSCKSASFLPMTRRLSWPCWGTKERS